MSPRCAGPYGRVCSRTNRGPTICAPSKNTSASTERARRAGRPVPRPPRDLDQAVPGAHGVDRALCPNADVAVQSADQELADLAGTPMGLVALGRVDQALDLPRQLVGVADRPGRAIGQGLETVFLVALENLVAGLGRNAERATDQVSRAAQRQGGDAPFLPPSPSGAATDWREYIPRVARPPSCALRSRCARRRAKIMPSANVR